jgi:hypothetical protein
MAGFYITLGSVSSDRIRAAAQRLVCSSSETIHTIVEDHLAIAWVSHDPPDFFAPAHHPETGIRAITAGRVAWTETEWQRAEGLTHFTGGLSNRLLLEQYLEGGITALDRPNGSAVVIIWDARHHQLHVLTDHFGFYPAFVYRLANFNQCVISSFPDAIADDSETTVTSDYVSMAEFLQEWKTTPPHTYYSEIKFLGAARCCTWNFTNFTYQQRNYWDPFQTGYFSSFKVAVEALTQAVRHAIQIRTLPRFAPIVTYISGGMDSRVIPFAATDPACLIGLNLYDVPNREAAISRQICDAANIEYVGYPREQDYYPTWLRHGVKISGAMWSAEDNHFMGTLELLELLEARTVLAAFPVDDLFKGSCLEQQYIRFFGRNLPFFQFDDHPVQGFLMEDPPRPSPPEFSNTIALRLENWFGRLPQTFSSSEERLRVEDLRIRPACYQPGLSDNMMFRIVPYDIFLGDRAIADCYSQIRPEWKINATLWSQVIAQICGREIVDANHGWRPGASNLEKLVVFGKGWLQRRITPKLNLPGAATEGSWSNLGWYALHSPMIRTMWNEVPIEDRKLITALWGSDPWQTPLEDWANPPKLTAKGMSHHHSPYGLFRILTLANYLSLRRRANHNLLLKA